MNGIFLLLWSRLFYTLSWVTKKVHYIQIYLHNVSHPSSMIIIPIWLWFKTQTRVRRRRPQIILLRSLILSMRTLQDSLSLAPHTKHSIIFDNGNLYLSVLWEISNVINELHKSTMLQNFKYFSYYYYYNTPSAESSDLGVFA